MTVKIPNMPVLTYKRADSSLKHERERKWDGNATEAKNRQLQRRLHSSRYFQDLACTNLEEGNGQDRPVAAFSDISITELYGHLHML